MSDQPPPPTGPPVGGAPQPAEGPGRKHRPGLVIGGIAIVLIGFVALTDKVPDPQPPARTTTSTTTTGAERRTPQPQTLHAAIIQGIGNANRDGGRRLNVTHEGDVIRVSWAINEGITDGFTKDNARSEATEILEAIVTFDSRNPIDYDLVELEGSYSMVDQLGNASEDMVVRASYTDTLIAQINFANFDFKNVFEVTDDVFVHPAFQY